MNKKRGYWPPAQSKMTDEQIRVEDDDPGYGVETCRWHAERVALGQVKLDNGRWAFACQDCSDEFPPQDWRPLP